MYSYERSPRKYDIQKNNPGNNIKKGKKRKKKYRHNLHD